MKREYKVRAYFLLALILFNTVFPTATFALSGGPFQPEYSSYEDIDTTDMVNLITGDFTYSIPLLTVPSPEGGFSLPLSYHAGIELDEESSWTGLGWNINPGVLDRYVSIFPDDYDGSQSISQNVTNPSLNGNGYVQNYLFYQKYYDSNLGSSGFAVNIMDIVGFNKDSKSGVGYTELGMKIDKNGFKYDFVSSISGLINLGQLVMPMDALNGAAWGVAQGASSFVSSANSPKAFMGGGGGGLSMQSDSKRYGFLNLGTKIAYKYFVDNSTTQFPLGVLYLGDNGQQPPPCDPYYNSCAAGGGDLTYNGSFGANITQNSVAKVINNGGSNQIAHDMHIYYQNTPIANQFNPSSIAYDNYNVKATGLSGSISPYRLEIGSLANPMFTDPIDQNVNFVASPYLGSCTDDYTNFNYDASKYKVPFKFNGDNSNSYTYNITGTHDAINTDFEVDWDNGIAKFFQLLLKNPKIYSYNYSPAVKKEGNRTNGSLTTDKLVHGNHIQWYSNDEISASNYAKTVGFMNCGINRSNFPGKGIGGFSITREDGRTYHFSLPVYNKHEYKRFESGGFISRLENNNKYATMWLLTAITGADFVDRGTVGEVDDLDWGYWVKFDYGMFNNNYMWRNPYFGKTITKDGSTTTYQRGVREQYYLNFIKTRTHTAVFAKSEKSDGKSFYESTGNDNYNSSDPKTSDQISNYTSPSSSLKLDDIYILSNEDFNKLFSSTSSGGLGVTLPAGYNASQNFVDSSTDNLYSNIIQSSVLSGNATAAQFLTTNQIQKIHFNYSYDLCPKTLNSFDGSGVINSVDNSSLVDLNVRKGKLTLNGVQFFGKNNSKQLPGYEFGYGNLSSTNENPSYDINKYDGYGFYKPDATGGGNTDHKATPHGDEWSLKKIITPLGSEINITYERDTYSEINGYIAQNVSSQQLSLAPITTPITDSEPYTVFLNPSIQSVASLVTVGASGYFDTKFLIPSTFWARQNFIVLSINESQKSFEFAPVGNPNPNTATSGYKCYLNSLPSYKYGGNLRVKEIINKDESGNQYFTKYDYILPNANSAGVASYESEYDRSQEFNFYELFDHPSTPIMYKKVGVSKGSKNGTSYNENTRTTFKFCTPHADYLVASHQTAIPGGYYDVSGISPATGPRGFMAADGHIIIYDRTSKIGRIESVTNYNSRGEVLANATYDYFDNSGNANTNDFYTGDNMGIYSESSMLFERFRDAKLSVSEGRPIIAHKFVQTTKVKYPNILKAVTINKSGAISKTEHIEYDFNTGKPTKTVYSFGDGLDYMTEEIPAYKKYPIMGSKAISNNYRNMMSSTTEYKTYANIYDANLLLSASVTTFKKNNLYRQYNSSGGNYSNSTSSFVAPLANHWDLYGPYYMEKSYQWKSAVSSDGSVKNSDYVEFNWASTFQNSGWVKSNEYTLFDNYSKALEMVDVNGKKSSVKYGYNNSFMLGSAENTPYGSWCYSGAEDLAGNGYYGGEVSGASTQFKSTSLSHTGYYSSKCDDGNFGFVYRGNYGTDFLPNKTYRASVWVHSSNAPAASLYCWIRSGGIGAPITNAYNVVYNSPTVKVFGDWYLFNLDVTIPANTSSQLIEFGSVNPSGGYNPSMPVYFDDFRVCLQSSPIETNVYDPKTGKLIATLDKENLATKFYYDDASKLIKTERESVYGFIKTSEHSYNYSK